MSGAATAGSAVLAQLLAQAGERGADMATLRAIAEEAGELGAVRALMRLGLTCRCWCSIEGARWGGSRRSARMRVGCA